ncbi:glia maturation factor beta [Acaromyces ingoldii]|uniref:Glia maturation factor beta n=1 Tax=Acaromyces ingoldii TaxID=215250 RepID=A0A316YZP7_9BASI|nr:glia maturation factor beta [Acaromyces ingoldii]PWN94254.1 glia maturation factor beta [Acaromyces ingoldii]
MSSTTVDVPGPLLDEIKAFRLSGSGSGGKTSSSALVIKIDKAKLEMSIEDKWSGNELADLVEDSLPENSPRFVLLSHTLQHPDGRVSFPLIILYWAPQTSSMELSTLYTSALSNFSVKADVGKVIDIRDGELDTAAMDKRLLG